MFVLGFLTIGLWRLELNFFYPAAYWLHCGVAFLPIRFLYVLRAAFDGLYAVPTSSSRAKNVGAWDVGQSEARLFLFVYLALGANCLHCKPYSFDCGVLCECIFSFECSECISLCRATH